MLRVRVAAVQALWALMPAPDAQASYQWLTRLALGCGKDDPRGMDARRADLAAALLSGRLTNAAPAPEPADATTDGPKHAPGWAVRALPDRRIQWITATGHRYHSRPHDYRPDELPPDLPPDKAPARRELPKDLVARLERIERDRRTTALWDGEVIPPDDNEDLPPF